MTNKFICFLFACLFFSTFTAQSICVQNDSDFKVFYEIYNRNTREPIPKTSFHNGFLESKQRKCHDHSAEEGDDWKIYRYDFIKIFNVSEFGEQQQACTKLVEGIINTLEISYSPWSSTWWCLDRGSDEDLSISRRNYNHK